MIELIAWLALLALLGLAEIIFAPARRGLYSPRGAATDRLMQVLTVVAVVGPPLLALIVHSPPNILAATVGTVVTASGIALRVLAMRILGERFQLTPRQVNDAPRLITTGPYAVVRHPGYTALLLAFTGLALIGGGPLGCSLSPRLWPARSSASRSKKTSFVRSSARVTRITSRRHRGYCCRGSGERPASRHCRRIACAERRAPEGASTLTPRNVLRVVSDHHAAGAVDTRTIRLLFGARLRLIDLYGPC